MSKLFSCEYCEYTSDRLYNLQRHVVSKHTQCIVAPQLKVNTPQLKVNTPQLKVNMGDSCEQAPFKCPHCYKTFKKVWCVKRHEPLCKGLQHPHQCHKCLEIFASKQSKYQHVKRCNGKVPHINTTSDNQGVTIHNNNTTYDKCNVNNGVVNNITVVNIRGLGEENMDYITPEYIDKRLMESNGKGIVRTIKDIHFNHEHPENHNIRKYNKDLLKVFENGDFMLRSCKSTIIDLIQRYKHVLGNRMFEKEFEKKVNCDLTLQQIMSNHSKFDMMTSSAYFFKCVRDIIALLEDLEYSYSTNKIKCG